MKADSKTVPETHWRTARCALANRAWLASGSGRPAAGRPLRRPGSLRYQTIGMSRAVTQARYHRVSFTESSVWMPT